jgi:hypothetical protein
MVLGCGARTPLFATSDSDEAGACEGITGTPPSQGGVPCFFQRVDGICSYVNNPGVACSRAGGAFDSFADGSCPSSDLVGCCVGSSSGSVTATCYYSDSSEASFAQACCNMLTGSIDEDGDWQTCPP